MSLRLVAVLLAFAGLFGVVIGFALRWLIALGKKGSVELQIKQMLLEAREESKRIVSEAEKKNEELREKTREELKEREEKIEQAEERLIKKEDLLDRRQTDLDTDINEVAQKMQEIDAIKEKSEAMLKERITLLEKATSLSGEEARQALFAIIEKQSEEDLLAHKRKIEKEGQDSLEKKARDILATTIQRLASSVASEITTTSVSIPNDDMKGKIIGKEGRNIKAFERATGVEILVDDTPGVITISSFDPVRRYVAKAALEELIKDGRVQPAKIEKVVEKAQEDINKVIKSKGEEAAYECGVFNLDPRIIAILGRLHFRTSYGQNVLRHSVEMAHIAGMLAEELGANVSVAKAGALLHDLGKALDHEVQGSHVEIGRRILQKFGVSEDIIKAMQAHHEEYPYETVESIIVQVADAISGSRPGARRDSVENYLKRLEDLENIANTFSGVEKAYAIQAGRELRVFVTPNTLSDLESEKLAREIALRIEKDLKYPGEIKVTVIRETRAIEFAR